MKFYINKNAGHFFEKIVNNKLSAIYYNLYAIRFLKNGNLHNIKNAAYIDNYEFKEFYLDNEYYGDQNDFTKKTWRKFVKLQAFL
jgi:hypothetical protein